MRFILLITLLFSLTAQAGTVTRANFTSEVKEREPVDELTEVANEIGRIYFFSELKDFEGEKVSHKWYYQNRLMADVSFYPKGPRWRVHSYKTMLPHWLGQWRVDLVANDETLIQSHSFLVVKPEQESTEELESVDLQAMEDELEMLSEPDLDINGTPSPTLSAEDFVESDEVEAMQEMAEEAVEEL